MRNEMKICALLFAFAQSALASDSAFNSDWGLVTFQSAVNTCKNTLFENYALLRAKTLNQNETLNQNDRTALDLAITQMPEIDQAISKGCYCELFAYAKNHSFVDFRTRKNMLFENETCQKLYEDSLKEYAKKSNTPEYLAKMLSRLLGRPE